MRIALISAALLFAVSCSSKTGPQGPQGETGPQGPAGATGAQGPQGERGETGAMGAMGATGATGETGAQGPQGLQGPQGAVLVVDGGVLVGPPGSSVVVTALTSGDPACTNGGVRITQLSDGGITNLCNGAQGIQGPQGVQGPAGAQGAVGQTGAQGPQGMQGAIGPQGAPGSQGIQGVQGAVGPQGPAGPTGAGGASVTATVLANMSAQCMTGGVLLGFSDGGTLAVCNGAQGTQGIQGATGPQGIQGQQGNPGATGSTGAQGATGSAGPAGPQGPMGATGPTGPAGAVLYVDGGVVARSSWVAFAGFTAATYNGNLGGIVGANTKCDTEYPGSFFCSMSDYSRAETNATPGAIGAWVDYERTTSGARDGSGCYKSGLGGWTEPTNANYANTINANGYAASSNCNVVHSLACCRSSHRTTFRGFTSTATTGNLGGIVGANTTCATAYPGSFFCSMSDYSAAETNASPGATGAWVDYERTSSGTRDGSGCYKSGLGGWTEPTNANYANTINANGYAASSNCNVVHTLACCSNN